MFTPILHVIAWPFVTTVTLLRHSCITVRRLFLRIFFMILGIVATVGFSVVCTVDEPFRISLSRCPVGTSCMLQMVVSLNCTNFWP